MNYNQINSVYVKITQRYPELKDPNSTLNNPGPSVSADYYYSFIKNDLHFFREAFDDFLTARVRRYDIGNVLKEIYGSMYYSKLEARAFNSLYPAFLMASLSIDEYAEETIELCNIVYNFDNKKIFGPESIYQKQCYIFDSSGKPRSKEFLEECAQKYNISTLLETIFSIDDAKALDYVLNNPPFKDKLTGSRFNKAVKHIDIPPMSECYKRIYGELVETPFVYLQKLLNVGDNTTLEDLDKVYKPELSPVVGHEFLFHRIVYKAQSPAQIELFSRLIRDGADWYCGFKQAQLGHHAVYSHKDSKLSEKEKFDDLIASSSKLWGNGRTLQISGVAALMKSFSVDELKHSIRSATDAKRLYIMTNNMEYLSLCSNKEKRNILNEDLGL
jgi:hypothetical protein